AQITATGAVYYYHTDHLGTPQRMTDSTAALAWSADYLPFGQADVTVAAVENNLRFAGQYYDNETGLHYNYWRYYDPGLGRYLRADPIGLDGGVNLYAYVQNNPIKFTDPKGLAIWICNRKTSWGKGNHAYFWDDRSKTCCGMGSTKGCKETGPDRVYCRMVAGSDGREDEIMKCCRETADKGIWFPPVNDCHEAVDDCLKNAGLTNPGAPGGRLGNACDPCEKNDPSLP
ncbi:MAG: RHS domain-containing protein, partial [Desulfobacterales bacterium]|nr:RHS domain-containing protein [Desulfobacterales bacterium]